MHCVKISEYNGEKGSERSWNKYSNLLVITYYNLKTHFIKQTSENRILFRSCLPMEQSFLLMFVYYTMSVIQFTASKCFVKYIEPVKVICKGRPYYIVLQWVVKSFCRPISPAKYEGDKTKEKLNEQRNISRKQHGFWRIKNGLCNTKAWITSMCNVTKLRRKTSVKRWRLVLVYGALTYFFSIHLLMVTSICYSGRETRCRFCFRR